MGLVAILKFGLHTDHETTDPEFEALVLRESDALAKGLRAIGGAYQPPPNADPEAIEFCQHSVGGYSALHHLRRYAVYVAAGRTAPPEQDVGASEDPILASWYAVPATKISPGVFQHDAPLTGWRRWLGFSNLLSRRSFLPLHLVQHSDCEGCYVPIDFAKPLEVQYRGHKDKPVTMTIGSSVQLLAELEVVAAHLELPSDIDPEADVFFEAAKLNGPQWQRYPTAARVCAVLRQVAIESVKHHALIVFT